MGSIKTHNTKTKSAKKPAKKKRRARKPASRGRIAAHAGIVVATVLVFVAGFLFDTQALVQLSWMGIRAGMNWLFHHKIFMLAGLAGGAALIWAGLQAKALPARGKRAGHAKKSHAARDPSRIVRPAQPRRTVSSRRSSMTPRS